MHNVSSSGTAFGVILRGGVALSKELGTTSFRCIDNEVMLCPFSPLFLFHLRKLLFAIEMLNLHYRRNFITKKHSKHFARILQNLLNGTALFGGDTTPEPPYKPVYGLNKCSANVSCPQFLEMCCYVVFEKLRNHHEMVC